MYIAKLGILQLFVLLLVICKTANAESLVAFIDKSDSMNESRKLDSAKEGLKLFTAMATDDDTLMIVSFDDVASVSPIFDLRMDAERRRCFEYIDALKANGRTDYLTALQAARIPQESVCVFLSDGAHNGPPEYVLQFVEEKIPANVVLHTIAVGCPNGSPADHLLSRMAAMTEGSYTRVDSSEALVRQFLNIAVQTGKYRGYAPKTKTVNLNAVTGRLLAFAFDGEVEIENQLGAKSHHARLPGEDVHFLVSEPNGDTVLKLTKEKTPKARLGSVYVDDLPVHRLIITNPGTVYRPGASLNFSLVFKNTSGSPAVLPKTGVAGSFELVDADGRVVTTNSASINESQLEGSLQMPSAEGTYKLRATSVWPRDGKPFSQASESVIIVKEPTLVKMVVEPAELAGLYPTTTFTEVLKIVSPTTVGDIDVKVVRTTGNIVLAGAKQVGNVLDLTFTASKHGFHEGQLRIVATTVEQEAVADVPFRFEVKSRSDNRPTIRLPILPAEVKPQFDVSKSELKLSVAAGEIARFELLVKPEVSHTGATKLETEFARFTTAGTPVAGVVASARWAASHTLRGTRGNVGIKGSILAPLARGQFESTLTIRAESGASVDIPITLLVE